MPHRAALVEEPATFIGPSGKAMTRLGHEGKIRRVLATRIAWTLTHNEQPNGTVRAKNGDDRDLRPDNLVLIKHCAHKPHADGGRESSLERPDRLPLGRLSMPSPSTPTQPSRNCARLSACRNAGVHQTHQAG